MSEFLKNDFIHLIWDEQGMLLSFINGKTQREYVKSHTMCRLVLESPGFLEFEAVLGKIQHVEKNNNTIIFSYNSVTGEDGVSYAIPVTLTIRLEGDDVHWRFFAKNDTKNVTLREIHYPIFCLKDPQPPLTLHTSELVSTTYPDLPQMLRNEFSNYFAPDQKYIRHITTYPGRVSSLNYYLLDYGSENLYFGCHDPHFMMTNHVFEIEKSTMVNCFMSRMPFLKYGEKIEEDLMVTSTINGPWTAGARKYRKWANSWYTAPVPPPHIRNSFGWQRVIMHHQYGEYFFRYADLPKILDHGMPAGIDTIFLFGWTQEGMDSGYPQYTPDPACGGFDELRKNILKVRAKGGHVILYYNGQLIDTASQYYCEGNGQKVSIKRTNGTEHREFYDFSNTGTFTYQFGNKTFVVACPACLEWKQILKDHIDFAWEVGADGVFFDQLGLASYPCCDPTHGHPIPFIGLMNAKRSLVKELYEYAKSRDPNFAFGVECTTDQTSQYCDFVHIFGNTAQVWNHNFRLTGERPQLKSAAPLFRTTFPETYLSDREIRDDSDVEFPVNQLVLLGRRSDVEVFRCRADLAAAPKYQAYLKLANELRSKFKDILLHGIPVATDLHSVSNPLVLTNAFKLDNQLAVIVTQSSKPYLTAKLTVPGYRMIDSGAIRQDAIIRDDQITLPCDSLAIILFQINGPDAEHTGYGR